MTRLHDNVVRSMRGNFLDVPTDCPQRDERLGWTGDLAVFVPTASYLYDVAGMLTSWLSDLAVEQRADGVVPLFVPYLDILPAHLPAWPVEAGWGDAAVTVPWTIFERFGDRQLLAAQWPSMTGWIEAFEGRAGARRWTSRPAESCSATGSTPRRPTINPGWRERRGPSSPPPTSPVPPS